MTLAFWLLIGVIAYAYCGYPMTVAAAAAVLRRDHRKGTVTPSVGVVVAAYNEADGIADRVRNLLESDYPADRLHVVVASDGSTDDTVREALGVDTRRVTVLDLERKGKALALDTGVRHARGEILVFTDANTVFRSDAIARLVRAFADPEVGGVAGRTGYTQADGSESSGRGEHLYWDYDSWLKRLETRAGSVVSAHGGMYAIRRELYRPVEDLSVTDDFAISTAVVAQGKRLVFEPEAIGYELPMAKSGSEFQRRVRLMTRGLRGVLLRRELLNPRRYGFYSIAFASRKVLRRLVPLTFPFVFALSLLLAGESAAIATFAAAQTAFLTLAAAGWALRRERIGTSPLLFVPFFFCLANAASLAALWNVARGRRIERWTPQRHEAGLSTVASPAVSGRGSP